jgi:FAD/FMN-containing dehydrogenase
MTPEERAAFARAIAPVPVIDEPALVKQKSRDFYWFSPILKALLRDKVADIVALPRNVDEVIAVTRECVRRRIPLTPRGGGTGNYGQAMPLAGGVIIDLSAMTAIGEVRGGVVTVEPGIKLADLEAATLPQGWELRFHPSTRRTATIGGFLAGGSGGVGSINFGGLRDPGNVLALKIVTAEPEPRVIELRGADVHKVIHAYGVNGIIVEIELPLARAWPWADVAVSFPDFMAAARFSQALGEADAIIKKLITPVDWGVAQYFKPLKPYMRAGESVALCMVAETSLEAFEDLVRETGGVTVYRGPRDGVPPIYEFTWNHTTLHALKVDRSITYLQTLFPPPRHLELIERLYRDFGDEVPMHLEFVNFRGQIACFGLPLVRFTTPERLAEIIAHYEASGSPVANPHTYVLEDGGMKQVDRDQVDFKKLADPFGLLNPGKMRGWIEAQETLKAAS